MTTHTHGSEPAGTATEPLPPRLPAAELDVSPPRPPVRAELAAMLSSAALAAVGLWFVLDPTHNPMADPDQAVLRLLLGTDGCTAVLLVLAGVGVVTAAVGARSPGRRPRLLAVVGLVEVLGLGIGLQSVSTIALAGYLVALALPLALVWLIINVIRRYRRLRWLVLLVVAGLLAVGAVSQVLTGHHLARLGAELAAGFARAAEALLLVVAVGASVGVWTWVLMRELRGNPRVERTGSWVQRHRVGLTVVAALGPVPYGLVRASWLTPWPLLSPAGEVIPPELRLWGLLLGGGAAAGCVLTLGLIRPWGRTFPRWVPRRAGQRVPPAAAIVPGALVAGIVTASAAPMLHLTLVPAAGTVFSQLALLDRVLAVLLFPFWIWGPALGLAVWGYARSRR